MLTMFVYMCEHVQVRGRLAKIGPLLPPCGFQGSSSGHQTWLQMLLPMEPSHQPKPMLASYLKLRCVGSVAKVCGLGSDVTNLLSV